MDRENIIDKITDLLVVIEYLCMIAEECLPELQKELLEYNMKENPSGLIDIVRKIIVGKINEIDKNDKQYIDDIICFNDN